MVFGRNGKSEKTQFSFTRRIQYPDSLVRLVKLYFAIMSAVNMILNISVYTFRKLHGIERDI